MYMLFSFLDSIPLNWINFFEFETEIFKGLSWGILVHSTFGGMKQLTLDVWSEAG